MNAALSIIVNDIAEDSIYNIFAPVYAHLPFLPTGAGYFKAGSEYFVERNNLNMYLIIMTVAGCGSLFYRGKVINLEENRVVLINGAEYHKYHTAKSSGFWNFKWIRFTGDYMPLYDQLINYSELNAVDCREDIFKSYFDTFIHYSLSQNKFKDILMCNIISEMLTSMCTMGGEPRGRNNFDEDVEKIRKYILEYYSDKIDLDSLARKAHLTKYSLIRKFKKNLGITPYAYLINTRVSNAAALLETTNKSMNEISDQVGFFDQNNFIKQFRLHTGYTPGEYRQRNSQVIHKETSF